MLALVELSLDVITRPPGTPGPHFAPIGTFEGSVWSVANLGVGVAALDDEALDDAVERLPLSFVVSCVLLS
jgi:hypothetical protein